MLSLPTTLKSMVEWKHLGSLSTESPSKWEGHLPHLEFAFNRTPTKTMGLSPFLVIYGINPFSSIKLNRLPVLYRFSGDTFDKVKDIKHIYEQVYDQIENVNSKIRANEDEHKRNVQFKVGDIV